MTDCPHCRRFREERDEALEALRQAAPSATTRDLRARIARTWPLQKQRAAVLAALLSAPTVSREQFMEAMESNADALKAVDTPLCHVRAFLRTRGFNIRTTSGVGWSIAPADRAKILAMLDAEAQP